MSWFLTALVEKRLKNRSENAGQRTVIPSILIGVC
jgi:hypothetical protein